MLTLWTHDYPGTSCPISTKPLESPPAEQVQTVKRKGSSFEFTGFLIVVGKMAGCIAGIDSGVAGTGMLTILVGFIVFIIGLFT